jgi:Ca-activated chloride channel family protein
LLGAAPLTVSPAGQAPQPVAGGTELLIIERDPAMASIGQRPIDIQRRLYYNAQARPPRCSELRVATPGLIGPAVLPLKHTDVAADISVYVASVTVIQKYHNPYAQKIEAVYVFPLPQDAAVRDFVMTIGERRIRGIIREREEAQRIYREARRQGHRASLLTQERPNIFTQNVANIAPGEAIDVEMSYFYSLPYRAGEYEFVFPMVVGPRYNPPGFQDGVGAVLMGARGASGQATEVEYLPPTSIPSHDLSLAVSLDAGTALREISSPSHAIEIERSGEQSRCCHSEPGLRLALPNSR